MTALTAATDLTEATPREIDTRLADIEREKYPHEAKLNAALTRLHRVAGDKKTRHYGWGKSHERAIEDATAMAAAWTETDVLLDYQKQTVVTALNAALEAMRSSAQAIADLEKQAAPLDAEYQRRPWPRFWSVAGGHVHSDDRCQTLHRMGQATSLGWMPELSGLDMAAVIAHFETMGTGRSVVLCSVCMPAAPVELFAKPVDPAICAAGGTSRYALHPKYSARYGVCRDCGAAVALTLSGALRKHKRSPESRTVVVPAPGN